MNKFTNSFEFNGNRYYYCDLKKIFESYPVLKKLPNSLKVLLEANIRKAQDSDINSIINEFVRKSNLRQIEFFPTRVIMHDYTGIPSLVDLASMREKISKDGGNAEVINPQIMVDLVVDHLLNVNTSSIVLNKENKRNKERYTFAKWASNQFENLSVIPPNWGVCDQVNLEYLSTMISASNNDGKIFIFPEAIAGTDSHTTMINALGVLGWKVGEIQLEASILGSSISFVLPQVVGVKLTGSLVQGVSSSDAALSLTNMLKEHNVKGKIVEFYGSALKNISLEDRATLSNMAPNYDALCGYFSVDENTISFVEKTRGVDASLIKEYYLKQGIFNCIDEMDYDENITFDLSQVRPVVSGPKKAHDKVAVEHIPSKLESYRVGNFIKDNDVVFAMLSSFSSTTNPVLLIQAGLLAKKACNLGLDINTNIKRSLDLSSEVVKQYLEKLDLLKYFEKLGFISILNANDKEELIERVSMDIEKFNLNVSSVISGNYNIEERIHPLIKSNWLMSPALVIAYCLKGSMDFDITKEPIFNDIYLSDIWPSIVEVNDQLEKLDSSVYADLYKNIFDGNEYWQNIQYNESNTYQWDEDSTYIQGSKFFTKIESNSINIENAKILAILDDSISTEYLSPLGQIPSYSPAAVYLESKGLKPDGFNTFANRRGNAEIIERGTLSNIKLRNKMVLPKEGGYTKDFETGELLSIFEFAQNMKAENRALVLFAGENYGIGESKDWAAKGTKLLGVNAVIAKSFDPIHKLNLIKMGILPLEFIDDDINTLSLKGNEFISIRSNTIITNAKINLEIQRESEIITITLQSTLDSNEEITYYKNGGVLSYLLKNILTKE